MEIRKKNLILDKTIYFHRFKGVEYIGEFLDKCKEDTVVYFDPDIDGLIAGLFICRALSILGKPYSWYINSNREHGFSLPIDKVKGKNIICVDFLIEKHEIVELVNAGCNILSLDHHENKNSKDTLIEYKTESNMGVVINNQYSFEEKSGNYLSGAGVVFESLLTYLGDSFNTKENKALVGLTLLTDVRNIENINARLYLQELYTHPYKGYIGYLLDNSIGDKDYGFGIPRLDRNYVDYKFSPLINSYLRFNKQDEVVEFILGSGILSLQYRDLQRDFVSELLEKANIIPFDNLNVVVVDIAKFSPDTREYISNFIGLLASRVLDMKKSCIAYVVNGREVGRASFRGLVNGVNYLSPISELVDGVGHEPAFGIKNLKPSKSLFKEISNICKKLEEGISFKAKYIEVGNFSMFANVRGYNLGIENIYCLSENRVYVKYTGKNIVKKRNGAKFQEYSIDGVNVICFNSDLDPSKDLILPIIERGVLNFYLDKVYRV